MPAGAAAVAIRSPPPTQAGSLAKHDRADFAQEFLRRNPDYRAVWSRWRDEGEAGKEEEIAQAWGLVALFDPARSVRAAPALWRADAASQVVRLVPAPSDIPDAGMLPHATIVATQFGGGTRNIVLDRAGVRHRLRLPAAADAPLAILLPPRGDALRAAACDAARRMIAGLAVRDAAAPLRPSALQRQRLALLLRVLDAWRAGASNREIGTAIVYPWLAAPDAVSWKASGERRRVQRLLADARQLAHHGYRALLRA